MNEAVVKIKECFFSLHPHSLPPSCSHSLPLSCPLSFSLSLPPSLSLSLSYSLSLSLPLCPRTTLSIGYFALSLNTANLHGDSYLNCFLSAAIELPAYTVAWLMYRYWPRRMCLFLSLFQGGVVLLFIHLIPQRKIQCDTVVT